MTTLELIKTGALTHPESGLKFKVPDNAELWENKENPGKSFVIVEGGIVTGRLTSTGKFQKVTSNPSQALNNYAKVFPLPGEDSFPVGGSADDIEKFLTSLSVDSTLTFTLSNGKTVVLTKTFDSVWRDEESSNLKTAKEFAQHLVTDAWIPIQSSIKTYYFTDALDTPEALYKYLSSTSKKNLSVDLASIFNYHPSTNSGYPDDFPIIDIKKSHIDAVKGVLAKVQESQKFVSPTLVLKQQITAIIHRVELFVDLLSEMQALQKGTQTEWNSSKYDYSFNGNRKEFPLRFPGVFNYLRQLVITNKNKVIYGFDVFNGTNEQYHEVFKLIPEFSWATYLDDNHWCRMIMMHIIDYQKLGSGDHNVLKAKAESKKFLVELKSQAKGVDLVPAFNPSGLPFPENDLSLTPDQFLAVKYVLSSAYPNGSTEPNPPALKDYISETVANAIPAGTVQNINKAFGNNADSINSAVRNIITRFYFAGIWTTPSTTFEHKGMVYHLDFGVSVYDYSGYVLFVPKLTQYGDRVAANYTHYGCSFESFIWVSETKESSTCIFAASTNLTYEDALSQKCAFTWKDWEEVASLEDRCPFELDGMDILTVKRALDDPSISISSLNPTVKSLIALVPQHKDIILFKEKWGHYPKGDSNWSNFQVRYPQFASLADPEDVVAVNTFIKPLSFEERLALIEVLDAPYRYHDNDLLGAGFALRDAILLWKEQTSIKEALGLQNGVTSALKPIADLHMGGGQKKTYFVDADGYTYMGKPNSVDKFRPDAEFAANNIARLFGYNVPPSAVRTLEGEYTYVQKLVPTTGTLDYVEPLSLDDVTLMQALRAHPLHWAISNHDLHGGNFLCTSQHELVISDLGQAWKALGKDELAVGWELSGNYGGVWYEEFYRAIQRHEVDPTRLDKLIKSVLRKALIISNRRDDEYLGYLTEAFQNRTWYPDGITKEGFISLAMDRKHSVFNDFVKFYSDLYADGGYDFVFNDDSFNSSRLDGTDAHLKIDEVFAEQVKKNGVYGKSLFFADSCVEDAHALFHTIQRGDKTSVHIDMKIRNEGDKVLSAWLDNNLSEIKTAPKPVAKKTKIFSNSLPQTTPAIEALVAYAKTVSVHSEDHQYNSDTVASAKAHLIKVVDRLETIAIEPQSIYVKSFFETDHQKNAWVTWAQNYVKEFASVEVAHASGVKAPMVSTSVSYTAPTVVMSLKVDMPPVEKPVEKPKPLFDVKHGPYTTLITTEPVDGVAQYINKQEHSSFKAYSVTLSSNSNVVIQYIPHAFATPGSGNRANMGRLQIEIFDWNFSPDHLEGALDIIRTMGLALEEASDVSLELFFWRHLVNIMGDRYLTTAEKTCYDNLKDVVESGKADELSLLRSGFSSLWGYEVVSGANWHPQFSDLRAHFLEPLEDPEDRIKSGRPYWVRPDFSVQKYEQECGGMLPSRQDGSAQYLVNGGYMSNEEKIRFTGSWGVNSLSANSDREKGSSQFAFVRQGQFLGSGATGFYLEPHLVARTHNYSFSGDLYGEVSSRCTDSPFNWIGMTKHGEGDVLDSTYSVDDHEGGDESNELMIKYGWSTWDDIAIICVPNEGERKILINFYQSKGIEEIRGIPLRERIIVSKDEARSTMKKIWLQYRT